MLNNSSNLMQDPKCLTSCYPIVPQHVAERIVAEFQLCQDIDGIDRWFSKVVKISLDPSSEKLESQLKSYFFELDVMAKLYQSKNVHGMTYEPKPGKKGKNCDLLVRADRIEYLLEIKHFSPKNKSRDFDAKKFPGHISVDIDERSYYHDFSIRSHLIRLALEVEEKFENYDSKARTVMVVPTGFHLDWLQLYGFVYAYRYDCASSFDYLGQMTVYTLKDEGIVYQGSIDEFWSCHEGYEGIDEVTLVDASRCAKQPIAIEI